MPLSAFVHFHQWGESKCEWARKWRSWLHHGVTAAITEGEVIFIVSSASATWRSVCVTGVWRVLWRYIMQIFRTPLKSGIPPSVVITHAHIHSQWPQLYLYWSVDDRKNDGRFINTAIHNKKTHNKSYKSEYGKGKLSFRKKKWEKSQFYLY